MNDILNDPAVFAIGSLDVTDCETGGLILDQRELSGRNRKRASDAVNTLAMHLMAYQLNQGAGACIVPEVGVAAADAQQLLVDINFDGRGRFLRSKNPLYTEALAYAATLGDYNNGLYNSSFYCGDAQPSH